jgi:hypothetical protein
MLKENKITFISIGVIVLALIVYLASNVGKNKGQKQFHSFLDPEKITSITISKKDKKLEFKKEKNGWMLQLKPKVIADSSKLLTIFDFINNSKIIQRVTKNKNIYSKFELGPEMEIKIDIQGKDKKYDFRIGKNKDYSAVFAMKGDDPYVYLLSKSINLDFEPNNWFYKKVMDFDFSTLDHISYNLSSRGKLKLFYEKVSDKFFIKNIPKGKKEVDLNFLKNDFSKISVNKFIQDPLKKINKEVSHEIVFKNDVSAKLIFYKSSKKEENKSFLKIDFEGKNVSDDKLNYIKKISENYMFEISSIDKSKYLKKYDDFFMEKKEKEEENNKDKKKK